MKPWQVGNLHAAGPVAARHLRAREHIACVAGERGGEARDGEMPQAVGALALAQPSPRLGVAHRSLVTGHGHGHGHGRLLSIPAFAHPTRLSSAVSWGGEGGVGGGEGWNEARNMPRGVQTGCQRGPGDAFRHSL